ncbi:hypothetical protein G5I_01568 [Acromyrmex echinatior]|uniref:Uncharacterized protein n=1 Tax=Acromyrmex echinatior TaxID=103372 RepID=F4W7Z1_ACREC|nr:hypothetical protein G5I_01568 [Acromyrmex echinatior]
MPIGIINLNTEGRLSPTLFHPTNPERYELSTHTYTVNCMNCIRHAELSFYHASLSPDLECFAVVRRSINMCLVTRNMLSLWVDARRRKKVSDRNGWKLQHIFQGSLKCVQEAVKLTIKVRVVNRPASLVDLFFFYDASSPDFVPNVTKQESIADDSIEQVFTTNGFRIFS